MTCGIYKIENVKNNKKYIGQSVNIEQRWQRHKYELNAQKHYNSYLQNAWNKYGENAFVFEIIEKCPRELLDNKERYWIQKNNSYENGYNLDNGGGGVLKYHQQYYRVIKKGIDENGIQRYQLIKDSYLQPIFTTIFKDEADKICIMLNDNEITENEAKNYMIQKNKKYRINQTTTQLRNLGVNYLINQSSKGYTQADICHLHNISHSTMRNFLKEEGITWKEVFSQGEQLKIQKFDKKNNIQQLLINGATNKQLCNKINCTRTNLNKYKEQNNIKKPHNVERKYTCRTNTGVQYLTLLKNGVWHYRKTYQNPNNIKRTNFNDIKQVIDKKGYAWNVCDKNKLKEAIEKSKLYHEITKNKKIGKKISKKRVYKRHKQKFAKKRALKVFRKMFKTKGNKIKKSSTGIYQVVFRKSENAWIFNKPDTNGVIQRQNLTDLEKEVKKQDYEWIIEDKNLLKCVQEEVDIYKKERKKPFLKRKKINFKFI